MRRIDPKSVEKQFLLPCNIYPFLVGNDPQSYALARVNLKLCCLLHDNITLPGSMALENRFVSSLLAELLPCLTAETIKLDLRSSCDSFKSLALIKHNGCPPTEILNVAAVLDENCKSTLAFDAVDTAGEYKRQLNHLLQHLLSSARKKEVVLTIERALSHIEQSRNIISLEEASRLLDGSYLSRRFSALAKLLYSTIGAKVTNSEAIIPFPLLKAAQLDTMPLIAVSRSNRQFADSVVMDYFSIDANAIDKLSATAILDMKTESLTGRYIKELDEAIDAAGDVYQQSNLSFRDLSKLVEDRAKRIEKSIVEKCKREQKHLKIESWVFGGMEEAGGYFGNLAGIGLIKKGLSSLARRLSKKNEKLAFLDYTSAPLATHVSRFRALLGQRRGQPKFDFRLSDGNQKTRKDNEA